MTKRLFLDDGYLRECEAEVQSVKDGRFVVLDQTVFYPRGGGQPHDTGKILRADEEFNVVFTGNFEGQVSHELEREGLREGDRVRCVLDWERRHMLMRMHTAAHVLAAIMHRELGALITGNQLEAGKSRFDFNLEDFEREKFEDAVKKANDALAQDLEPKAYTLPREEAMKIPGVVKLASALPPDIPELRIVEIPGLDMQADGGTHVRNLKEVGKIGILKLENKGKNNRRVYFTLASN
ncbi:MAG: alanyl-tRNA editing protein AlaXM [Candidatus Micrarchaeota archaeon]